MTPGQTADTAEADTVKDDAVLEREGVEQELMQQDRSEVGERIAGVDGKEA